MNQFPTHRSSESFAHPDDFVPERFLFSEKPNEFANDKKSAFQPFGIGRHSCIGQTLAYAEMRLILARLLYAFDISLADPQDVWDWGAQKTYIFWEKRQLNVRLTAVNDSNTA